MKRGLFALVVLAACSSAPEPRRTTVSPSNLEGFVIARLDANGCFSEDALVDYRHEMQRRPSGTFGQPWPETALEKQLRVVLHRVRERVGRESAWKTPAAIEFDAYCEEFLVRQRAELVPSIEIEIAEIRRERNR